MNWSRNFWKWHNKKSLFTQFFVGTLGGLVVALLTTIQQSNLQITDFVWLVLSIVLAYFIIAIVCYIFDGRR